MNLSIYGKLQKLIEVKETIRTLLSRWSSEIFEIPLNRIGYEAQKYIKKFFKKDISVFSADADHIRKGVFYGYSKLTSVEFPVALSVGSYAFGKCSALTEVRLPQCETLEYHAFTECPNLTDIYLGTFCTAQETSFDDWSNLTVHVPQELLTQYTQDPLWQLT